MRDFCVLYVTNLCVPASSHLIPVYCMLQKQFWGCSLCLAILSALGTALMVLWLVSWGMWVPTLINAIVTLVLCIVYSLAAHWGRQLHDHPFFSVTIVVQQIAVSAAPVVAVPVAVDPVPVEAAKVVA